MRREAFRRMAVAAVLALLPAAVQAANAALTPGIQAFEARRYEEARAFFEPYAKRNPKDAEAAFYLGKAYLYLKKSEPAADWLEKATALAPNRSDYFDWLGRAYGQQAIEASVFAKLLKTDPATGTRNKAAARAAYQEALKLDPRLEDAKKALASLG